MHRYTIGSIVKFCHVKLNFMAINSNTLSKKEVHRFMYNFFKSEKILRFKAFVKRHCSGNIYWKILKYSAREVRALRR